MTFTPCTPKLSENVTKAIRIKPGQATISLDVSHSAVLLPFSCSPSADLPRRSPAFTLVFFPQRISTETVDKMVKTTYALTVFAAVSMAAPMAPNGNDYTGVEPMRRDGSDTLIGAGTDSALNQLVGQLYSELQKENADAALQKTPKQKAEVAEALKNQKPSILHGLPLIGGLFTGVSANRFRKRKGNGDTETRLTFIQPLKRSVEEELHARSLTGDLSHLPLLGELFGGVCGKKDSTDV